MPLKTIKSFVTMGWGDLMFEIKEKRVDSTYKSLYLPCQLIEQITEIAKKNKTSFNHVVVSMIEHCIKEEDI